MKTKLPERLPLEKVAAAQSLSGPVRRPRRAIKGDLFSIEGNVELIRDSLERAVRRVSEPKKLKKLIRYAGTKRFERDIGKVVASVTRREAAPLLGNLKRAAPAMLQERWAVLAGFQERLYYTWQEPLDLLEMLIVIAAEVGEMVGKRWPWRQSPDDDLVFDVVRRLHARGCQVAAEVLTLLKAGFAAGAHARWRTLHETAVTALFIDQHGRDTAERYLAHEYVETHEAARHFLQYRKRLRERPLSEKTVAGVTAGYQAVLQQYGDSFGGRYGWAAAALGRPNRRFGFSAIESAVSLDHLRPYYQLASHPVHANPKAIRFSLGLLPGQDLLLTGPSNLGLSDPGQGTALSLYQLTVVVLMKLPTIGSMLVSRTMGRLVDEISDAFVEAQKGIERRIRARRRSAETRRRRRRAEVATRRR